MTSKLLVGFVLLVTPLVSLWAGPVEDAGKLIAAGNYGEARRLIEKVPGLTTREPQALVLLTHALVELEDYKPALEHGKAAIKALPADSEAHLQYARAIRVKMQKASVMKAMFSVGTYKKELAKAIELDPKNVGALIEQIGFLTQAPGIAGGSTDKAREKIAVLKKIDWRNAMIMQAELYDKLEEPDQTIATYREMIERDPQDHQTRTRLGYALQSKGSYEDADREFAQLLESEDDRRVQLARYQLARSRVLGEYDQQKAVDYLLEYIEHLTEPAGGVPSRSSAYWRLGLAYEQLNRKAEARRALEQAIQLDGDNKPARQALKRL